jgi:2-succinyl-6-hydroxy-2,4-cyclohexadiene-1-carboxylate synthase
MERRVAANGVELAFEDLGSGARPLVLVHGFTGFRGDFAPVLDALRRHAGRVVALDLRGHGASTHTGDEASYTLEALARDVGEALAALRIARCDLLGHSMGGMLAQRVALSSPERVASLLLASTSAEPLAWIDEDVLRLAAHVGREHGMAQVAEILRARAPDDPARSEPDRRLEREWGPERFWAWRTARVVATDPAAYPALGGAMKRAPDLRAALQRIARPTSVIVGALDAEFAAPSARLAAAIPEARHVVLPQAGHQPQLEAPEAFVEAVRVHLMTARP